MAQMIPRTSNYFARGVTREKSKISEIRGYDDIILVDGLAANSATKRKKATSSQRFAPSSKLSASDETKS